MPFAAGAGGGPGHQRGRGDRRAGGVVNRLAPPAVLGGVVLAVVTLLSSCAGISAGGDGAGRGPGVDDTAGGRGEDGADGTRYSHGGDAVTGSGRLASRRIGLGGVTGLDVGAGFDVLVRLGEPEQATIRMDDNLTGLVESTVAGDRLRLGLLPGASVRDASLTAEVTVAHLDRVTANGVSTIRFGTEVAAEQLQIDATGMSRVTGRVRADQLMASASGAGVLELSGDAGRMELSGAGTSGFRLSALTVRDLDIELSGTSCATVTVRDNLTAKAGGVSALRYRGSPRINRDETAGLSSIAPDDGGGRCGGA